MCDNISNCCKYIAIFGLNCDENNERYHGMVDALINPTKATVESVWDVLDHEVSKDVLSENRQNNILIRCCVEYLRTYTRAKVI